MTMVFDRYPEGGNERLLALAMADHARDDGTRIWPSLDELARKTLQSRSTVKRQIKHMVQRGWLELVRGASGRPGDTNEYRINAAWIAGQPLPTCPADTGFNLNPLSEPELQPEATAKPVDNVIHTGFTSDERGFKSDERGFTAVTPESSGTVKNHIPPLPPVATGGLLKNTAAQTPNSQADPPGRPRWRWRESRKGVEAMGERLGVGRWDQAAFDAGRGEQYPTYRSRVLAAHAAWEADAVGQSQRVAVGAQH